MSASIPLGATAPGGWHPDSSTSPDRNVSLRDRGAESAGSVVARSGHSASITREPTAALPPQRVADAARPYTWIMPAAEIEAIEWLPTDSGLEAERSPASFRQSRYWLLPRWVGHVGVCVSLLAGVAVAIELIARARSESAEPAALASQPGHESTVHAQQGSVGLAPATLTGLPPVVLNRPPSAAGVKLVAGAASAAEPVDSKPTQTGALPVQLTASPPAAALAAPKPVPTSASPLAAAEPPPSAASTRVAAIPSSGAERVESGAATDSLHRAAALSPAATPGLAPRNAPQPASPSPAALTTNPASAPSGGKAGMEVGSQPKTLDAMKLL